MFLLIGMIRLLFFSSCYLVFCFQHCVHLLVYEGACLLDCVEAFSFYGSSVLLFQFKVAAKVSPTWLKCTDIVYGVL